jgi:hypothetical protein
MYHAAERPFTLMTLYVTTYYARLKYWHQPVNYVTLQNADCHKYSLRRHTLRFAIPFSDIKEDVRIQ